MFPTAGTHGVLLGLALAALAGPVLAERPVETAAKPAERIPVEPLGFVPPSKFYKSYRVPSSTLDFLDDTHLLFTFHVAKLMRREPDDPAGDQDQTVRALVLSVPGGRVESEGTWRLHDRGSYLWPLRDGYFLTRQRNTLYVGDAKLTLKPYLHPEGTLASVQLSPDASTLTVQYSTKPAETDPDKGSSVGDAAPSYLEPTREYHMMVIDTRARVARRVGRVPHLLALPLVEGGFLDVEQGKGKQWRVMVRSFAGGEPRPVAAIESPCEPRLHALSQQTFLASLCLPVSTDHLVQAWSLDGKKLWEQVWQSRFTWGTYGYTQAGNRFAYGTVEVNHELASLDPVDEASIVGQPVGVFSLASGKLETVVDASPILTAGNNFALSPDGSRFAVLRNGAIELFALPRAETPSVHAAPRTEGSVAEPIRLTPNEP